MEHVLDFLELSLAADFLVVVYDDALWLAVHCSVADDGHPDGTYQFVEFRLLEIAVVVEHSRVVERECGTDILLVVAAEGTYANDEFLLLGFVEQPGRAAQFGTDGHAHVLQRIGKVGLVGL